jgi:acyl-CoA synthetase (AMP-forming)/AMP-acid ligase II
MRWVGDASLPDAARTALMGPGARFEIVVEDVLGVPTEVFAQRHHSLRESLIAASVNYADRVYMATPERDYTFAEAARIVGHLAEKLATEFGVGKGDRVAVASANSAEYAMVNWATIVLGGIIVGLNGWWTSAELEYGIALTEPTVVLADAPRRARLAEIDLGTTPLLDLETILDGLDPGPSTLPDGPLDEDDPFLILFTSGTTGRPKGAVLSHRNFLHFSQSGLLSGAIGAVLSGVRPDPDVQLASLMVGPLFHVSGIVPMVFSMDNGTRQVLPPPGRWTETSHFELTEKHRIQMWSGVPTQFWRLLQHADFDKYDLSCVFAAGGGGANFPPDLVRLFLEKMPGISLRNGYGMSESAGMGTVTVGPMFIARPDAVGTANPATEIEIRDPFNGELMNEGDVGEIHMRTAAIFLGYWNNDKATAEALLDGRWYRTGDFGRIENGMLHLESRMRDMIIRAGENIYPLEIENRLIEHPDIDDVAVIGVAHKELGQEVMAVVVRRVGSTIDAAEVQRFAAEALARYKVPAHVVFIAELPYTQSGKVLKHELEREYTAD